jgi:hypothetical protein
MSIAFLSAKRSKDPNRQVSSALKYTMCDSRGRCLHLSTRTSQEKVLALSTKTFQVLSSSSQTTFFEEQMTDLLLIKYFRLKYCQ